MTILEKIIKQCQLFLVYTSINRKKLVGLLVYLIWVGQDNVNRLIDAYHILSLLIILHYDNDNDNNDDDDNDDNDNDEFY